MVVSVETVAVRIEDIATGVPIACNFPAFAVGDIRLFFGNDAEEAVNGIDYVVLIGGDFSTFSVTPQASLLTKINDRISADPTEENFVTIRRELDLKTDATAAAVRNTQYTSDELDRTAMRFQQLDERLKRAIVLAPTFVGDAPLLQLDSLEPSRSLVTNSDATAIVAGPTVTEIANAEGNAISAAASASLAASLVAALTFTSVADASALATTDFEQYDTALIHSAPYVPWVWKAEDFSARIDANDPRYIAPASDPTGETGAWERAGSYVTAWAPPKWPSVDGSLYSGPIAHVWHRTGGYGTFGLSTVQLSDDDELPTGEFSVASTAWASAKHQSGGTIFGGWIGSNSPNFEKAGHIWTSGAVVGLEVNSGNRGQELGLVSDLAAAARWTVGVQIVPTWTPSDGMGPPAGIFHGSFGVAIHKSVDGHKWWTGWITSVDTIVPTGIGFKMRGGSTLALAPSHGIYFDGYHTNGIVIAGNLTDAFAVTGTATRAINLANGTFTTAILMAAGQGISWGTGNARISTAAGGLSLSSGNADDDFAVYANNFASRLFAGDATGGVPRLTFYGGLAPVAKQTVTGAKGGNAALTDLIAKLAAVGLIIDGTS